MNQQQRGGTFLGLIIGVVIGLGAALAVAVYVTKVPVPFMSKNQSRTPEQDAAETRKNQNWDPNAPLYGKNPARPAAPAEPAAPPPAQGQAQVPAAAQPQVERAVVAPSGAVPPRGNDPLGDLAAARSSAGAADPFLYFVQAGAFRTAEDAETQRAKLSLMGLEARVTEREQSGRPVYRVRIGPFDRKDDADRNRSRLESGGFEAALVRVQR